MPSLLPLAISEHVGRALGENVVPPFAKASADGRMAGLPRHSEARRVGVGAEAEEDPLVL